LNKPVIGVVPENVNKDQIQAKYEDGVLKLTLPKKEETKKEAVGQTIEIQYKQYFFFSKSRDSNGAALTFYYFVYFFFLL
jgi:hypothetical protein